jgi:hypothetical protein
LSNFCNCRDNVLKYHEVETNVDIEDGRDEAEEQLNETVFLKSLLFAEWL